MKYANENCALWELLKHYTYHDKINIMWKYIKSRQLVEDFAEWLIHKGLERPTKIL